MGYWERLGNSVSAQTFYLGVAISAALLPACMSDGSEAENSVTLQKRVTLYGKPQSYTDPVAELSKGEVIYPKCREINPESPQSPFVLVTATQEQKEVKGYVTEAFVPNMKRELRNCG